MRFKTSTACAAIALLVCACASQNPFKEVAKTDIDNVTDMMRATLDDQLLQLTLALYRLNPKELKKIKGMNLEARIAQITQYQTAVAYKELNYKQGTEAVQLAFDDSYRGDRVFALMIGISSMVDNSYNNKKEFFIPDTLDPQKLYDSALNLKVVHRKLSQQNKDGRLIATGNVQSVNDVYALLSRATMVQEMIANIIADRTGRVINRTLRGIAGALMPIGVQ